MKKLVQQKLARIARRILRKYKPRVIAITGSIGKTSTKEAVFAVMSAKHKTRKNIKNYNNEWGLPLTIIGSDSPKRNLFKWIKLFVKAWWMTLVHVDYPQVLVLELGIDRPGDMDYLMDIVKPDVAILTGVGVSHMKYFGSEGKILEEKSRIFRDLGSKDYAILNADDPKLRQIIPRLKSRILTYGTNPNADIQLVDEHLSYSQSSRTFGTIFRIKYRGETNPVFLENTLGLPHMKAAAAAAAAGIASGITLREITAGLENYEAEPGRLKVLPGVRGSIVIDDTYNAAPQSTRVALEELSRFPSGHKIAVLGDMLELGKISLEEHSKIADLIMADSIDYFIAVGPGMKNAYNRLKSEQKQKANHFFHFNSSTEAINKVRELLNDDTAVLVKGSQGMRMEKIVREIIAEPEQADKLLCRQEPDWLQKE